MNIGQIVTIIDTALPMTGIITDVNGDIYQVTTLTGTRYAREAADLTVAGDTEAALFAQDVKILAPTSPELAEAFAQVIEAGDEIIPGVQLKDIPMTQTMPSGVVITRRQVAAEMMRTRATELAPALSGRASRSVAEMI